MKKSDFSLNGQLYCEFKYAPFSSVKRRGHQPDSEELELSGLLKEALEAAVCLVIILVYEFCFSYRILFLLASLSQGPSRGLCYGYGE